MTDLRYYLELQNFPKRLEKLSKSYKNKKIVLYGCGEFFHFLKEKYNLSVLNIIAISDKRYIHQKQLIYDESLGYNVISPEQIYTLKPDIVLISVLHDIYIERYFCEELFKKTHKKFKYSALVKLPLSERIRRYWTYD